VAGIGQRTYYDWKERYPELEPRLLEARETARQKALETIKRAAPDDWRAAESFLKLSFHNDYNHKNTINVSANAQAGSVVEAIELTDPARAALIEKRERALAGSAQSERELTAHERTIDKRAAERTALPAPKERYVQMTKHGRFVRELPDGSVIDAEVTPVPREEADACDGA
jgi:hypothetical protein